MVDIQGACKLRLCRIVLEIAKEKSAQTSKTMRSVADESHTDFTKEKEKLCDETKD